MKNRSVWSIIGSEYSHRLQVLYAAERVRYAYLATLGATPTQIIYGREGGRRFAIRIEADERFLAVLSEATARAGAYSYDDAPDDVEEGYSDDE